MATLFFAGAAYKPQIYSERAQDYIFPYNQNVVTTMIITRGLRRKFFVTIIAFLEN